MKSVALVIVLLFLFCYLHFCSTFWFLAVSRLKFCSIYFHKTHLAHCLSYFYAASLLQAMSRSTNISHQMEYLLATGNLVSRSGLGLMQVCCLPLVFPTYFTLLSFYSLSTLCLFDWFCILLHSLVSSIAYIHENAGNQA